MFLRIIVLISVCLRHSREGAAMASGPPDVMTNQEAAEVGEECSGNNQLL